MTPEEKRDLEKAFGEHLRTSAKELPEPTAEFKLIEETFEAATQAVRKFLGQGAERVAQVQLTREFCAEGVYLRIEMHSLLFNGNTESLGSLFVPTAGFPLLRYDESPISTKEALNEHMKWMLGRPEVGFALQSTKARMEEMMTSYRRNCLWPRQRSPFRR